MGKRKKIFIIGVNGFIGSALAEKLLQNGNFEVFGLDIKSNNIRHLFLEKNFHFKKGNVRLLPRFIEKQVAAADIVLPLAALATPIKYVHNPLSVFELDFEENLKVIRYCVKHKKRIIFPSTSEVYGMSTDKVFNEDLTPFTLGPTRMQRWIYSCCKQMLERVIWAYGQEKKLPFTIFRPFNWIGPRLDSLASAHEKNSRVVTQLIMDLVEGRPVMLVGGGRQKRCFTDLDDGIECLLKIIEDKRRVCNGKIFNIGNPDNETTIRKLTHLLVEKFERHPLRNRFPAFAGFKNVSGAVYYGKGYQDIPHRKPSIANARRLLNWRPSTGIAESLDKTLDYFLKRAAQ
jgi:UDP-4-amino-4-deoxy-L-arabinose formyltransferase/UDP-glucuronic acid dehydrogenase (UDP-4-keto-hexauronic acid decarboxylating)